MGDRWLIVFNPRAKNGRSRAVVSRALELMDIAGVSYDVVETKGAAEGMEVAASSRRAGYSRLVAIGGDGTMHYTANGAIAAGIPFGVIPAGSGNDFAGAVGISGNVDQAVDALLHGQPKAINIVRVITSDGAHYSINMVDAGIGAEVAFAARRQLKWLHGSLRYNLLSLATILRYRNVASIVTLDDGAPVETELTMLICGFGQTAAAGMHLLPESRFVNDKMRGFILHRAGRLAVVGALRKAWRAEHTQLSDIVQTFSASKVAVETVDQRDFLLVESEGEVRGRTTATMEVVPRGLEVFVPRDFSLFRRSRLVGH